MAGFPGSLLTSRWAPKTDGVDNNQDSLLSNSTSSAPTAQLFLTKPNGLPNDPTPNANDENSFSILRSQVRGHIDRLFDSDEQINGLKLDYQTNQMSTTSEDKIVWDDSSSECASDSLNEVEYDSIQWDESSSEGDYDVQPQVPAAKSKIVAAKAPRRVSTPSPASTTSRSITPAPITPVSAFSRSSNPESATKLEPSFSTNIKYINSKASTAAQVYMLCATLGLLPTVAVKAKSQPKKHFEVTISLKEHDVQVQETGLSASDTIIAASVSFLCKCDTLYKSGRFPSPGIFRAIALPAIDIPGLMQAKYPGISVQIDTLNQFSVTKAEVMWGDRVVGKTVLMSSQNEAMTTAWITAAVELKLYPPKTIQMIPPKAVPSQQLQAAPLQPMQANIGFPQFRTSFNTHTNLEPLSHLPNITPVTPKVEVPNPRQPTLLDYSLDPSTESLIQEILDEFSHLTRPRNLQLEGDGDYTEIDNFWVQVLGADEAKIRSAELLVHAKKTKRFKENTVAGGRVKAIKAEMTINQQRGRILQLISDNPVVVIAAATGSGKTTQLPQIILEDAIDSGNGAYCNIWVTQPRRIAAVTVARRVRAERFDGSLTSVGFHVKFDAQPPKPGGSITYCTTGILLNRIQRRPDEVFDTISHIIVDEVHERDMIIDRLLALLKWQLSARSAKRLRFPKVILSSATLDVDLFTNYFAQHDPAGIPQPCPYLDIPGRMFPVQYCYLSDILAELQQYPVGQRLFMERDEGTIRYLELEKERKDIYGQLLPLPGATDADNALIPTTLIALTIAHIVNSSTDGAILIFLPGLDSLQKVQTQLQINSPLLGNDFNDRNRFRIILLHGDLKEAQQDAFDTMPKCCRKIVLSTNIAETSVTIPDCKYVIDSGKHKEKIYDPHRGFSQLQCSWASKSSCKQRAGRSGRVQNGFYYALYSKQRAGQMRDTILPEILRSDLQEICLQLGRQPLKVSVRDFLNKLVEAPEKKAVDASLNALKEIEALTDDEEITALGRVLASLPVHPSMGKMIVLGIIFRCLDPMLILASATNVKDFFQRPLEAKIEAKQARMNFSSDSNSDHLATIKAFDQARSYAEATGAESCKRWLRKHFINFNLWREVYKTAEQMEQILIDARLIRRSDVAGGYWKFGPVELNQNAANESLIKALIMAGFHPNVAATSRRNFLRTMHTDRALMSNQSVNAFRMQKHLFGQLYAFSELSKSTDGMSFNLRDSSTISLLMPILFGRNHTPIFDRQLLVDGWIQFRTQSPDHRQMLVNFKAVVDNVLADAYAQLGNRTKHIADDPMREKLGRNLGQLLDWDTRAYEEYLETRPEVPDGSKRKGKKKRPKPNLGYQAR